MQKLEVFIGGFDRGSVQFNLYRTTIFDGFRPKVVSWRAVVEETFGDVLAEKSFKTKRGAKNFLDRWAKNEK